MAASRLGRGRSGCIFEMQGYFKTMKMFCVIVTIAQKFCLLGDFTSLLF